MKERFINIRAKIAIAIFCASFASHTLAQGVNDTSPPTAPSELIAIATSDSEVRLNWDPAIDDRQVVAYVVRRDGAVVSTSANTFFTDTGLSSSTRYSYRIVASDGSNLSAPAIYTVTTLAAGASADPSGKPVETANNPVVELVPTPSTSSIVAASSSVPAGYTNLVFSDEFNGNGSLDVTSNARNWRFETMDDGLHRAGNSGIDANGNVITGGNSVQGKRWSGWYNDLYNENTYRSNGVLAMEGRDTGQLDPTRPIDYLDNGTVTEFGASKLYTSWIDTFGRIFDNSVGCARKRSAIARQVV